MDVCTLQRDRSIVLSIVDAIAGLNSVLAGLYSLAILLPSLAVGVRRHMTQVEVDGGS